LADDPLCTPEILSQTDHVPSKLRFPINVRS